LHRPGIDTRVFQARLQSLGKKVGPEGGNHVDRSTEFRDGHGLVGALSSVEHIESATKNGLSRVWQAIGARHQVDVDAAHYQQLFVHHRFLGVCGLARPLGKNIAPDFRWLMEAGRRVQEGGGAGRNRTSKKRLCRPSPDHLGSAPF
jgi:hypothetical protein